MIRFMTVAVLALLAGGMISGCCSGGRCPFASERQTLQKEDGLFQKEWVLQIETLNLPENTEKPLKEITMQIAPDGKISGSSGVNRYFGTIQVDSAKKNIDFQSGALASTKMAGHGMKYEQAFFEMLKKVDSYEIREGRLFLKSAGKVVAELRRKL